MVTAKEALAEWLGGLTEAEAATYLERLQREACLLYTSDAADDLLCVDLGGRRIIKKKKTNTLSTDTRDIIT